MILHLAINQIYYEHLFDAIETEVQHTHEQVLVGQAHVAVTKGSFDPEPKTHIAKRQAAAEAEPNVKHSPLEKVALPAPPDIVDDVGVALRVHVRHLRLRQRQPVPHVREAAARATSGLTCR